MSTVTASNSGQFAQVNWAMDAGVFLSTVTFYGPSGAALGTDSPGSNSGLTQQIVGYGTSWTFTATDSAGHGYSGGSTTPVAPITTATALQAVPDPANGGDTLRWTSVPGATSYAIHVLAQNGSNFTVTGVTGTSYTEPRTSVVGSSDTTSWIEYYVMGANSSGNGPPSNTVRVYPGSDSVGILIG